MELKSLLNGIEGLKAKGNLDTDVKGITHNSKNVKEGYMFIAIKGFETDGHNYIKDAVENGAKVIVIQEGETIKKSDVKDDTIVIWQRYKNCYINNSLQFLQKSIFKI